MSLLSVSESRFIHIYNDKHVLCDVQIFDADPYQRRSRIINSVRRFFSGGPLSVQVNNDEHTNAFAKVSHLSKCLNKAPRKLHKKIGGKDWTLFLQDYNVQKEIEVLTNSFFEDQSLKIYFKKFVEQVGHQSLKTILNQKKFDLEFFLKTIAEVGKVLSSNQSQERVLSETSYSFEVTFEGKKPRIVMTNLSYVNEDKYDVNLCVDFTTLEIKEQLIDPQIFMIRRILGLTGEGCTPEEKKIFIQFLNSINAESFEIFKNLLLSEKATVIAKAFITIVRACQEHAQLQEYSQLIDCLLENKFFDDLAYGIKVTSSKFDLDGFAEFIEMAFNKNNSSIILTLLQQKLNLFYSIFLYAELKAERRLLFNTLIKIGRNLQHGCEEIYVGRKKGDHFAFAFNKDYIFIAFNKKHFCKNGRHKVATIAWEIKRGKEYVRLKLKHEHGVPPSIEEIKNFEKECISTKQWISKLSKNAATYFAPPFIEFYKKQNHQFIPIKFQLKMPHTAEIISDFGFEEQVQVFKKIATGLAMMHKINYAHLDIKPQNVLVKKEKQQIRVQLTDLGGARLINKESIKTATLRYLPPEAIQNEKLRDCASSDKIDSFSLGIFILDILIESFYKQKFNISDYNKNYKYVGSIQSKDDFNEIFTVVTQDIEKKIKASKLTYKQEKIELLHLCQKLLTFDPKERLSCMEALSQLKELEVNLSPTKEPFLDILSEINDE